MEKYILGLDLGTNSIAWSLIQQHFNNKDGRILGMGTRIIPMSQDIISDFGKGKSISQTAERTAYHSTRIVRERHLLRRERLHRVLHILGFLPEHYDQQIDFKKYFGKFISGSQPKLVYNKKEFLFKDSFHEMLADFKQAQPDFLKDKKGNDCLIPYDWTIYFLRKKALTQKIEKEELAWILLNFNQKRGYYQLRGEEEEENPNKSVVFYSLQVLDVVADEEKNKKGETWYSLHLENGWTYRRSSKTELYDWKDKVRDFIVTTDLNEDGTEKKDKDGNVKRSFRAPGSDDWTLMKKKTEQDIAQSTKTVGEYIYDHLLLNPKQKIKGKLVRTIERKFYKEELEQILKTQLTFHSELQDTFLLKNCIEELYRNNKIQQQQLVLKDFVHLFVKDIIFYQRPLRSQKSNISNCSLEFRMTKNEKGENKVRPLKVIAKSNPYYQEFRVLQWIHNLAIYRKEDDVNVSDEFFNTIEDKEELFDFLNHKKDIEQKILIRFLLEKKGYKGKVLTAEIEKYRWNYVMDKKYPCNETKAMLYSCLSKVDNVPADFLSFHQELNLWHLIYSVTDKEEYNKALKTFARRHQLNEESFFEAFRKFPPFKSDYGSFSQKAILKLLPLMRFGKNWDWNQINTESQDRIAKIITGEYDEEITDRVREKAQHLTKETDFQQLPLWLAQYVVYGRHSEATNADKWYSVKDLENYIASFKQHSLRNPIVEQIVLETLRVVRDIWIQYGKGDKDFFNEIHIELGRDLKNTAEERERITTMITENENTNQRIKALLAEMALDKTVENARPYSPSQQEILRIYEDGVLNSGMDIEEDILKISKAAQPSNSDLKRYKLWLEQKYRSPYTGQIIPLNKLFTSEYEIEHIIPQSIYFDDSFSNKIICEAAVNKLKDNTIGLAFIKKFHGQVVDCGMGKQVKIFEVSGYEEFVNQNYAKNRTKRNKLLMEDIPEKMIERQLNDTRYISKYISGILSNIVRSESNDDGVNSKNLISGNGKITTALKQDWGLNDIWNDLILPRFERMNVLTNSSGFTSWNENYQKYLPTVPIELSKSFSKKRVDHRHHALDALIIACATRDHVNFMNNEHALKNGKTKEEKQKFRFDLRAKLCDKKYNSDSAENYQWVFKKPWETFTTDSKNELEKMVVSFKQNLRVINKATNYYEKWVDKNGTKVKETVKQEGINWAIRKPLHKETVSGKISLDRIKVGKGKILTATRKSLDTSFNENNIETITDTGIQKILSNYLKSKNNNSEIAFSPEGIEEMNQNIRDYNEGKLHQPILKVRVFEQGSKFQLGETGDKTKKYVEAAKGTNLFFAVYEDKSGKRNYETIALNLVIERQKQGLSSAPEVNEKGHELLFVLSPNDLVYVPMEEEDISRIEFNNLNREQASRIYKMVSSTGSECHFIHSRVATLIKSYDTKTKIGEFGSLNKLEVTMDNSVRIKEKCIKLKVDRLGNISKS